MSECRTTHYAGCDCHEARRNARVAELEAAVRWALGEEGDFPLRGDGQGAYWWRTELRRRAALASAAAPQEPDAVDAAKERVVEAAKAVIGYPLMLRHTAFDWLKRELEALRAAEQAAGRREDV